MPFWWFWFIPPFFSTHHCPPSLLYLVNFSLHCPHQSEWLEQVKSWCDLGLHTKIANKLTSFPQCCKFILCLAQCKGIQIPESRKFTLVESGIWEHFAHGIWNPGFWNLEYSSRNLESHYRLEFRIQVLLTNTRIRYLESGIHSAESRIQDCPGFPSLGQYVLANRKPYQPLPLPPQSPPPPWEKCIFLQSSCWKNKPHQRVVIGNFPNNYLINDNNRQTISTCFQNIWS